MSRHERENPEHREYLPKPSQDFAWMLGTLAARGSTYRQGFMLEGSQELVDKFSTIGKETFRLPVHNSSYQHPAKKSGPSWRAAFYSTELVKSFGDMSKDEWVDTVKSNHKWIYENEDYVFQFLTGFFDLRGSVNKGVGDEGYWIHISHSSERGTQELLNLLESTGIHNAVIKRNLKKGSKNRHGIQGIGMYRWREVEKFASNVTSCIPHKEERLEVCRNVSVAREMKKEKLPEPSEDLAWLLGVLSAGGSVSKERISSFSMYPEFTDKFKQVGERVFRQPAALYHRTESTPPGVRFGGRRLAKYLGDLRHDKWPETVRTSHPWVYDNDHLLWQFLTGYYDASGRVENYLETEYRHLNLVISARALSAKSELSEMLSNVGFEMFSTRNNTGVVISSWEEIKEFAKNVNSCIPHKEAELQLCRTLTYTIVPDAPESYKKRLEAYEKVMRLREENSRLGATKLSKHPKIVEYNLSVHIIQGWIYKGYDPRKDNRFFKRTLDKPDPGKRQ